MRHQNEGLPTSLDLSLKLTNCTPQPEAYYCLGEITMQQQLFDEIEANIGRPLPCSADQRLILNEDEPGCSVAESTRHHEARAVVLEATAG